MNENNHQLSLSFGDDSPLESNDYLLLSLKKEYYDSIRSRSKRFEYRRIFRRNPTNAFIYLTSPDKQIPGYVQFGNPIIDTPEEISELAEKHNRGHGESVLKYLEGVDEAFAIPINGLFEFKEPLAFEKIQQLEPQIVAPQSYIILNTRTALLKFLLDRELIKIFSDERPDL